MRLASQIGIAFVAAEHLMFLILEMFFWTSPLGRKVFGLTEEFADKSANLAANQGLYNGFLAAGLVWSFFLGPDGASVSTFFLACVSVAGIFGAFTAKRSIFVHPGSPCSGHSRPRVSRPRRLGMRTARA